MPPTSAPTRAPIVTPRPSPRPSTPTPTPAPLPLTIWAAEEGEAFATLQRLVAAFADESGQPVTLLSRPPAALRASLISAELIDAPPPDLIWGDQDDLAELLAEGLLQPVDEAVDAELLLPAVVEGATRDGQRWGVPIMAQGGLLLYYNRAIIATAPPTTDALIVAARVASNRERFGLLLPWGQPRWLMALLHGFGGAPTDPSGTQLTLDTPAMVSALNLLVTLQGTLVDDPPLYGRSQRIFSQGFAGLTIDGDWAAATYRAYSMTLDLGIAPLPITPATGQPAVGQLGGTYLMFWHTLADPQRDRAIQLARLLSEPAVQLELAIAAGRLPALRAALADPTLLADPARAALAVSAEQARGLPPTKPMRCALSAIEIRLGWLFAGDLTVQETAAAMQRDAEDCATK